LHASEHEAAAPPAIAAVSRRQSEARRAAAELRAIDLLAATLRAEAGSRPVRAVEALAALVMNRARCAAAGGSARLRFAPLLPPTGAVAWPVLIAAACRAPFLFACWRDAASRAAMQAAGRGEDLAMATCRRIAGRAVAGTLPDPTGGATHWHPAETLPPWAVGEVPVAEIGGLVFFSLSR
jgi:spore germination cell wall hydrolase CwlJ-like protein